MKIVIDIGHPAHVHYFRNFIKIMKASNYEFLIFAREKEITTQLLDAYGIEFISRGKGGNTLFEKLLYIPKADWQIYKTSLQFKPDLFLSFASTYAAHAAYLSGKPHIAFDDTEHAKFELMLYSPFTTIMVNPKFFQKNYGKKQIRFDSFMELSYLHKNYFKPDPKIRQKLEVEREQKIAILRFISWGASHDIGQSGIPIEKRKSLIDYLESFGYRVFVSSEKELSEDYNQYLLPTKIDEIHDVLATADLFIGESGTMSTEAALLGTPSLYINSLDAGVFQEEVRLGILYSFRSFDEGFLKLKEMVLQKNIKEQHHIKALEVQNSKEDVTSLMVDLVKSIGQ